MYRSLATLLLFALACFDASASCPSSHFQPALRFGAAFGGAQKVADFPLTTAEEALVFQYIEYQTREPGHAPMYTVSLARKNDATYRAVLVRLRRPLKGKQVARAYSQFRSLPASLARRLITASAPVLRATRYPAQPCSVHFVDGFVAQAFVVAPSMEELAGEVFAPTAGSPAGQVVALGRALRKYVEDGAALANVDAALAEMDAGQSTRPQSSEP